MHTEPPAVDAVDEDEGGRRYVVPDARAGAGGGVGAARDVGRRRFLRHASAALLALGSGTGAAGAQDARMQVFFDPATRGHQPGAEHPERPARLDAVMSSVRALEQRGRLSVAAPRPATEDEVLLVHAPQYLATVRKDIAAGRRLLSTGDTELSGGTMAAALAAAGTVVSAVDAVLDGRTPRAFCAVRPPGHHASAQRGMGFCVFNNIAIGARRARRQHGVDRVLIADWDVHHGNGTQDVFWADGSVLFFDTHQHPWYPGTGLADETGDGSGRGLIVNRPFPAGSGRREVLGAFRDALVPAADRFRPELVMISAGFDSRSGDPLGQFTLSDQDFADLTDVMLEIAAKHSGGRVVSVLEGGYALDGLQQSVGAHLARLSA
jgi:acetoin utilization deacetylase AcuC-like enzyme